MDAVLSRTPPLTKAQGGGLLARPWANELLIDVNDHFANNFGIPENHNLFEKIETFWRGRLVSARDICAADQSMGSSPV